MITQGLVSHRKYSYFCWHGFFSPTTKTSLLPIVHFMNSPAPRLLCWLLPLPGILFPKKYVWSGPSIHSDLESNTTFSLSFFFLNDHLTYNAQILLRFHIWVPPHFSVLHSSAVIWHLVHFCIYCLFLSLDYKLHEGRSFVLYLQFLEECLVFNS